MGVWVKKITSNVVCLWLQNNQMESNLGKNLFHHWSEQTQLKCEKHEVLWSWNRTRLFSLKWWLDELLPPKFQQSLGTHHPLQHQLQAKEEALADLTSIINIVFILPQLEQLRSAVLLSVVKYFLWRKQDWQAPHTTCSFIFHSFSS